MYSDYSSSNGNSRIKTCDGLTEGEKGERLRYFQRYPARNCLMGNKRRNIHPTYTTVMF